jgi:glycerol-3-phosphate acyltransferase PlsY
MPEHWLAWVAIGYLCGSIPFGLLLGRCRGVDIRKHGSGNIGATNAGRVLGWPWGVTCLVLDVLKGLGPVFLGGWAMGLIGGAEEPSALEAWRWLAVAAAAVVGHVFPIWLKLKGGKGVATGLGAVLGIWPTLTVPALLAVGVWGLLAAIFKYVSLASIVAAAVIPGFLLVRVWLWGEPLAGVMPYLIVSSLIAALVVLRHSSNLKRLLAGCEPRLDEKLSDKHATPN